MERFEAARYPCVGGSDKQPRLSRADLPRGRDLLFISSFSRSSFFSRSPAQNSDSREERSPS